MSIQRFAQRQRGVSAFLLLPFLAAAVNSPALARAGGEGAIRVSNEEVRVEENMAVISYDLDAPPGETYVVTVVLLRESDLSFRVIPTNATGDIGEIKTTGTGRLIRWDYLKDMPAGFRGEDYYFRIEVNRGGGFPWLWVGLGSAAVAGVLMAVMGGKSGTAATVPQSMQELPYPSAR